MTTWDPLKDPTTIGAVHYLANQAREGAYNGREEALVEKCAAYLLAVLADRDRLRALLLDIAEAPPDIAESQVPYWARKALCQHDEVKPHARDGVPQCTYCWEREGLPS